MHFTQRRFFWHFIMLAGLVLPYTTSAQLTNNLMIDGSALSMGNAVTADPPKVHSIHYNPAGLTRLKGRHLSVATTFVYSKVHTKWTAPDDYRIFASDDRERNPIVNGTWDDHNEQQGVLYVPGHGGKVIPKILPIPIGALPGWGFSINPPGSKFTFANAAYFQMAGGGDVENDDPMKYTALRNVMQRFTYLSPTVAYEVNDRLSIGLSIGLNHHGLYTRKRALSPNMLPGINEMIQDALCGPPDDRHGFALSFIYNPCGGNIGPFDEPGTVTIDLEDKLSTHWTVGVLWDATDWITLGVNYQSESNVKMVGTMDMQFNADWYNYYRQYRQSIYGALNADQFNTPHGLARERAKASLEFTFPQKFDIGISLKPHPRWKINIDAHWVDWSVWDQFEIHTDRDIEAFAAAMILRFDIFRPNLAKSQQHFKSTWSLGVGVEYKVNDRLKLRFGMENRPDSIDDAYAQSNAGLSDTILFGAGAEYKWDPESTMDFYVAYLESSRDIPANTSINANTDSLLNLATNPYAGLDIETGMSLLMWGVKYTKQW